MKRYMSLALIFVLLMSTFLTFIDFRVAEGAIIGESGSIPAGGSPGRDGGYDGKTSFRVGLISESFKEENYILSELSNGEIIQRIRNHYANHFPKMEHSIMFAPADSYVLDSAYGWYSPSNGELNVQRRPDSLGVTQEEYDKKLRRIDTSQQDTTGKLFFGLLRNLTVIPDENGDLEIVMENLANGVWKDKITAYGEQQSIQVWNYILNSVNGIHDRLRDFIKEEDMDSDDPLIKHEARLSYLDLLMTLYNIVPEASKAYYENEIDRFIEGRNLEERPVLIAIDTVTRFSATSYLGNTRLFVPSTEFVNYHHQATHRHSITNPDFEPGSAMLSHTRNLIKSSADQSIQDEPNRSRLSHLSGEQARNNGFAWGYSGVTGWIFRTASGSGEWINSTAVQSGVMEALHFQGSDYYGFIIVGGPNNKPFIQCDCAQSVTIVNKEDIEGDVTEETIGQQAALQIHFQEASTMQDWEAFFADKQDPITITVTLEREGGTETPQWQPLHPSPALGRTEISVDEFLSYLGGSSTMVYNDDLMDYEMAEDSSVTFTYNASIIIEGFDTSGHPFTIECEQGSPAEITFRRGKEELPQTASYISVPQYFSEIKQGSPGNEAFEAMAGTPTTRSLYFATGGSEFIVDIEIEYVPDAETTRTYRSYFSGGVASEFKAGDQAPTFDDVGGQSVNGHTGGSVTRTWSGPIPWTGTHSAYSWDGGGVTNEWDYSAQEDDYFENLLRK